MTTPLIVLAVAVFLVFDAVVLWTVFARRRRAADHAAFAVPGEITVELPSGKATLSYQESYTAGSDGDSIDFGVPSSLSVTVTGADTGEVLEIKGPGFRGMGESLNTGRGWSRAKIGTITVARAGSYLVVVEGGLPDAVEPQVLIGP